MLSFNAVKARLLMLSIMVFLALPAFAQGETPTGPEINFTDTLGDFWATFNDFFSSFAPILLPILAIPAAFAFLMFLGQLLVSAFQKLRSMSGSK